MRGNGRNVCGTAYDENRTYCTNKKNKGINMSEIKVQYKKMSIDQAINKRMNKEQEQAYLELMNVWINQRD